MKGNIHRFLFEKADLQGVGQAEDGGAVAAKASADAVVVRAGGRGHGDGTAGNFYGIAAAGGGGDGEALVFQQGHGFYEGSPAVDLGPEGGGAGEEAEKAQNAAQKKKAGEQKDPGPGFHHGVPSFLPPGISGPRPEGALTV